MTLGEVVADEDGPLPNGATATMPIAADTWTMGDDVDDDVLTRLPQVARTPGLTRPTVSLRNTRMCWWTMFGTNARG